MSRTALLVAVAVLVSLALGSQLEESSPLSNALVGGLATFEDGLPVEGLSILYFGGGLYDSVFTDTEGRYRINIDAPLTVNLLPWFTMGWTEPAMITVTVSPGDTLTDNDFTVFYDVDLSSVVMGRVIDSGGRPIEGVFVDIFNDDLLFYGVTEADGYYAIEVAGGYSYTIECFVTGGLVSVPASYHEFVGVGDTLRNIDFTVGEATMGAVSGRVVFADGSPAAGIYIDVAGDDDLFFGVTNSRGDFFITVIGDRYYEVKYYGTETYISDPPLYFEYVADGDTVSDLDFVLHDIDEPNALFFGSVLYDDGRPASGVTIVAWAWEYDFEYVTATNLSGEYWLPVLGGFNYDIDCHEDSEPLFYERFIVTGDTIGPLDFVIETIPSYEIIYDVSFGWNSFSAPSEGGVVIGDAFSYLIPPAYTYNPTTRLYEEAITVYAGQGFWLLSAIDTTTVVDMASDLDVLEIELNRGWNLFGGLTSEISIDFSDLEDIIVLPLYRYNPAERNYIEAESILPGIGYWILVTEDVVITLE